MSKRWRRPAAGCRYGGGSSSSPGFEGRRSGTAGEGGVAPGTTQHTVEAATAACAGRLGLVAEHEGHEEEQQCERGSTDPEDAVRRGGGGRRLGHRLQLRTGRGDLRRLPVV